jgi:type I restriction enzyme, S subunit
MSDLPKGWVEAKLGDLASRITKGTTPKTYGFSYTRNGVRFVKAESLDGLKIVHSLCAYVGADAHDAFRRSQLAPDDVLFTIAGTLGRVAIVSSEDVPANTNQAVAIIKLKDPAMAPFIARYLSGVSTSASGGRGIGLQNLNLQQVSAIQIPVPPLPEQRQIIGKLNSLLNRSQSAREELGRIPRLVERHKQALLSAAFQGELTHEDATKWQSVSLGEVITKIESGKNVRCEERPPRPEERGIVKVSSVSWGTFDALASKTPSTVTPLDPSTIIKSGDFLLSRANTLELVGACVVVDSLDHKKLHLSDKVLRIKFKKPIEHWVLYFLRSKEGRAQIETLATGNQLSMRNISQAAIKAIRIPLPPSEVRNRVLTCIKKALASVEGAVGEATRAHDLLDRLDEATLAKAFHGELLGDQELLAQSFGVRRRKQ